MNLSTCIIYSNIFSCRIPPGDVLLISDETSDEGPNVTVATWLAQFIRDSKRSCKVYYATTNVNILSTTVPLMSAIIGVIR